MYLRKKSDGETETWSFFVRVPVIANGNDNGSNVVGDRNFRNTRTRDVLQESSTTAAAQVGLPF